MAINYPGGLDGTAQFGQPSGTTFFTGLDHASLHDNLSTLGTVLENMLGTNASTGLFSGFSAGQTPLPIKSGTLGTVITKGTLNNLTLGSASATGGTFTAPTIAGQGTNSGTISGGVYGTALIQGGTGNNMTLGTPAITGGTANSITLGTPTINGLPWTNFTPVNTGFSGVSTNEGQYIQIGNLVIAQFGIIGTSNSTAFTTSAPIPGVFSPVDTFFGGGVRSTNNGTLLPNGAVFSYASGTTINLYPDFTAVNWTNVNSKSAYFTIMYRV